MATPTFCYAGRGSCNAATASSSDASAAVRPAAMYGMNIAYATWQDCRAACAPLPKVTAFDWGARSAGQCFCTFAAKADRDAAAKPECPLPCSGQNEMWVNYGAGDGPAGCEPDCEPVAGDGGGQGFGDGNGCYVVSTGPSASSCPSDNGASLPPTTTTRAPTLQGATFPPTKPPVVGSSASAAPVQQSGAVSTKTPSKDVGANDERDSEESSALSPIVIVVIIIVGLACLGMAAFGIHTHRVKSSRVTFQQFTKAYDETGPDDTELGLSPGPDTQNLKSSYDALGKQPASHGQ